MAEPNGLYTSMNTNATWVLCVRSNGDVVPVYSEPKVITFSHPIDIREGRITERAGGASEARIQVGQR